jgi:hypothetical protein
MNLVDLFFGLWNAENLFKDFWAWICYCPKLMDEHVIDHFGCTHPIDGLFWNLPIYLLGFFPNYECWVTDLIMSLYHFNFLGCHLHFCITRFHIIIKHKKQLIWLILFYFYFILINIQIISFKFFLI